MLKRRYRYIQCLKNAEKYNKIQEDNYKLEIIEGHIFTIDKPMSIEEYENALYAIPSKEKKTRFKNVVSMILIPMISEHNNKEFVRDLWYTKSEYTKFAQDYRDELRRSKYYSI